MGMEKMIEAAKAGGAVLRQYFGQNLELTQKSMAADLRTKADLESEKAVLNILQKAYPDYNIMSEETGEINRDSEYTFFIDPLDGTNNFTLGIPNFSVGIGLMKGKKIIKGVVYQPILDQVYHAERDKGAFLNGKPIKVNQVTDIKQASLSYVVGYATSKEYHLKMYKRQMELGMKRMLTNWSVINDYCLIASGKMEAMVCWDNEVHDNIAGKIIAREAGAVITDYEGNPEEDEVSTDFVIGSTKEVHKIILDSWNEILNK